MRDHPRLRNQPSCDRCGGMLEVEPLLAFDTRAACGTCSGCGESVLFNRPRVVVLDDAPWAQLIAKSSAGWWVWWVALGAQCRNCHTRGTVEGRMRRIGLNPTEIPTICVACGLLSVSPRGLGGERVWGMQWSPPGPAVIALRELI